LSVRILIAQIRQGGTYSWLIRLPCQAKCAGLW
jgi:hypothetical protein